MAPSGASPARIDDPPAGFPDQNDWFERVCDGLVLLEPLPLAGVQRAVERYAQGLEDHRASARLPALAEVRDPRARARVAMLRSDHDLFRISIEQLGWFLAIVRTEDHGGHRQALGQYGRLVCEAMRRHLAEESALGDPARAAAKG